MVASFFNFISIIHRSQRGGCQNGCVYLQNWYWQHTTFLGNQNKMVTNALLWLGIKRNSTESLKMTFLSF